MKPERSTSRVPNHHSSTARKTRPFVLSAAALALATAAAPLASSPAGATMAPRPASATSSPAAGATSPSTSSASGRSGARKAPVDLYAFAAAVQRAQFLHYLQVLAFAAAVQRAAEQAAAAAPPVPYGVWDQIAACESGGNWAINTGAYDGGLQFLPATWRAYGGAQFAPHAYQATRDQQIAIAERVLAATGGNYRASWPGCSRHLGLP